MEFEKKVRKADNANFVVSNDVNTKENNTEVNAFVFTIHDASISTSAGCEIEQNKVNGAVSTIMSLITQYLTYFDIIDEIEDGNKVSSIKQIIFNKHKKANRGVIRGHLPSESVFEFQKSFKKLSNGLGFELEIRTSNREQDILHTTLGDNAVNHTISSLYLYIPNIIPSRETQRMFN